VVEMSYGFQVTYAQGFSSVPFEKNRCGLVSPGVLAKPPPRGNPSLSATGVTKFKSWKVEGD